MLQGNAELLAGWGKDDPAVRDTCIAAIQRQTAYMHRMVENLLFLTRGDGSRQALQRSEVDLPALLEEVAEGRREIDPLAAGVLAANTALLTLLTANLGMNRYLAKLLTEGALFFVSWLVQHTFVFRAKKHSSDCL